MCIRAPVFIINSRFTQHNKPEKVDAILCICKTQLHIKLKCRDLMLVAHLVEQVACIKAESLMQRPGFESSLGPVLHVIPSLFTAFPVSFHYLYQNWNTKVENTENNYFALWQKYL